MAHLFESLTKDFSPQKRRTDEHTFEKKVCNDLARLDLPSFHVADRWLAGVPDRYFGKGRWVEFKSVNRPKRPFTFWKFLDPAQRSFMASDLKNDRCYICILFETHWFAVSRESALAEWQPETIDYFWPYRNLDAKKMKALIA